MELNYRFDFSDKYVLVTGASRGIGFEIAKAFAQSDASVVLVSNSDSIISAAEELRKINPRIYGKKANLANKQERSRLISESIDCMGGIDVLVNNAGVQIRHKPEEFPLEDWESVIEVNLNAVFDLCRLSGIHMLNNGGGSIINIASMLSYFGGITVPAYAASKGGVAQLTKALSNDWASRGIRVNAIAPGYIDTNMNEALIHNPERFKEITSRIPMMRFGHPEEIAPMALFLASDAAAYISGAVIPVDGGYLGR